MNHAVTYGGVCMFDYDGDRDMDLFFTRPQFSANRLYRNDGDVFVDVSAESGADSLSESAGCLAVDYDGDGDEDLYVANHGFDRLYRNDDGVFSEVTAPAAIVAPGWSVTATAGDIEGDGDLDIFVSRQDCSTPFCGGARNLLFVNQGDGTFVEEGMERGFVYEEPTLVALFMDLNEDGAVDLYVGNDHQYDWVDRMYINQGDGVFVDKGPELGLDMNHIGSSSDTMGVDLGDYDLDGAPDLVITNFTGSSTLFYECDPSATGALVCNDVAAQVGLSDPAWLNWAVGFVNFDQDGDQDLFMVSGLLNTMSGDERDQLYWNEGGAFVRYEPVDDGDALSAWRRGSGAAFGDIDNDGDVDVVVANLSRSPDILRNDIAAGHWLMVELVGVTSNRSGIGARVQVTAGDCSLTEQRFAGNGFTSSSDHRLHFGLGEHTVADVIVYWPSGFVQRLDGVAADQVITVVEGVDASAPETP